MLDEASRDKKQKVATGFIRDELHAQDFAGPISLRASKVLGPISRRVAEILPHLKLLSRASLGSLLVFCASFAMGYARLKDFTLRVMNKCVGLDVRMNPTLSLITTCVLSCRKCLPLFGDRLRRFHEETISNMTCSPRCSCEASSLGSW